MIGGPFAVLFIVWSVIINSFEGHPGRTPPHIFKKVLEFLPSFAKSDTALNVAIGEVLLPISASRFHCSPSRIFPAPRRSPIPCFSVGDLRQPLNTSATFRVAASKRCALNDQIIPATATDCPKNTVKPIRDRKPTNYDQFMECLPGKIQEVFWMYNRFSQDASYAFRLEPQSVFLAPLRLSHFSTPGGAS